MQNFRKLGIQDSIIKVLPELHIQEPTEIQEKSIPLILQGKDVIAGSATGSGKTLAFSSGIIHTVQPGKGIQSLVLTPTRELAEQVSQALKVFSRGTRLNTVVIYGGVAIGPQMRDLTRADVVIGTPGRILDHVNRRTINLTQVSILVLDEADRMFDMGFKHDVEQIIRCCPEKRQTLCFSATLSQDVTHFSQRYMHHPVKVAVECYVDPKQLTQVYYDIHDRLKFSLLAHLLQQEHPGLVIVFCNSRRAVEMVTKNLKLNHVNAHAIHGGFSQAKRNSIMEQVHAKRVYVLVCTDVAARGLDIKGVSHVYNYDLPIDSKQYIHRIGRTARAGKAGKAVNLLSPRDHDNFQRILRENEVRIPREELPEIKPVPVQQVHEERRSFHKRPSHFGRSNDRHSRSSPHGFNRRR